VVELAEMPAIPSLLALAAMTIASPSLVREGLGYRRRLGVAGVRVLYGAAVTRVEAAESGLTVHVARPTARSAPEHTYTVDTVCLGYGFHPSNEILRALGCAHDYDATRDQLVTRATPDGTGKTTVPTVFALGDCTGLGGARMALAQGTLAGLAAASELGYPIGDALEAERARAQRELARHRRFQSALWRLYAAPHLGIELATPATVVCRCEEVNAGQIEAALSERCPSIGELKRTTRAGMGACQGRYCGPLLSSLMANRLGRTPEEDLRFAPRVPLKPIPVADIARPSST
ncbi:MAG: (2Fe-2S)-binding protein, partial [Stellaceae bacterium]